LEFELRASHTCETGAVPLEPGHRPGLWFLNTRSFHHSINLICTMFLYFLAMARFFKVIWLFYFCSNIQNLSWLRFSYFVLSIKIIWNFYFLSPICFPPFFYTFLLHFSVCVCVCVCVCVFLEWSAKFSAWIICSLKTYGNRSSFKNA
jgi:hypothetical protein